MNIEFVVARPKRARVGLGAALGVIGVLLAVGGARAGEKPVLTVEIRNHRFSPDTLDVPADTRFVLLVKNLDPTPEEFESYELNREVVIPGGTTARVNIGPLKAGSYPYFGEFNQATAKGTLVAK